ncbi:MAG: VOC family protein [Planctomycetota bacterium]|jgi:catechol 2,3-dioxygenase-like lactoylglutathione lyase family enzyme
MHLEHVNMTVIDLDAAIDFYRRLLGFEVRWRRPAGETCAAAHVGRDDFFLALFQADPPAAPLPPREYGRAGLNHVGFVVDDLDASRARLLEMNVMPHHEAAYEPGRRLYFMDPSGIEVELVEYASPPV